MRGLRDRVIENWNNKVTQGRDNVLTIFGECGFKSLVNMWVGRFIQVPGRIEGVSTRT